MYIEGRLQTRKYQDKEGVERYSTEIVGSDMQMLGGGEGRGEGGGSYGGRQSGGEEPAWGGGAPAAAVGRAAAPASRRPTTSAATSTTTFRFRNRVADAKRGIGRPAAKGPAATPGLRRDSCGCIQSPTCQSLLLRAVS